MGILFADKQPKVSRGGTQASYRKALEGRQTIRGTGAHWKAEEKQRREDEKKAAKRRIAKAGRDAAKKARQDKAAARNAAKKEQAKKEARLRSDQKKAAKQAAKPKTSWW